MDPSYIKDLLSKKYHQTLSAQEEQILNGVLVDESFTPIVSEVLMALLEQHQVGPEAHNLDGKALYKRIVGSLPE